ncbi:hypothetical protein D9M72_561570 [compost metagenome]
MRASLVSAPTRLKNTVVARSRVSPLFSRAMRVLSKVGLALLLAIASTSFSCWAIPASKAGAKSLSLILSNCG